jgi:hypothetical protein
MSTRRRKRSGGALPEVGQVRDSIDVQHADVTDFRRLVGVTFHLLQIAAFIIFLF